MLIITGTMGAGKTAVLAEVSDILAQRQIVHAAIDLVAEAWFRRKMRSASLIFRPQPRAMA